VHKVELDPYLELESVGPFKASIKPIYFKLESKCLRKGGKEKY